MKKIMYTAAMLTLGYAANAQVGLGTTTPDASAILHLESSTKGLRLPQVSLTDTSTFAPIDTAADPAAAVGLYVYSLTAPASADAAYPAMGIGVYYWDGTGWISSNASTQDLRAVGPSIFLNHLSQDAGVGANGTSLGTGSNNVAIGSGTMFSITDGINNIALGSNSLVYNTSGSENIAIAVGALSENVTSSFNIAIGSNALHHNAGAMGDNIAIGRNALNVNQGDNFTPSIAIGMNALKVALNGYSNTVLGTEALKSMTDGKGNTAMGDNALSSLTAGNNNVAVGYLASRDFTGGDDNTALGFGALATPGSGYENVALGSNAMSGGGGSSTFSGNYNVAVGTLSLIKIENGASNVAVGPRTGRLFTSGDKNLFLGADAGSFSTAGNNNIAIGSGTNLPSLTGDNQMNIGNTIHGTNMGTATANVGINTNAPNSTLQVNGSFSTNVASANSDYTVLDNDHTIFIATSGTDINITLPTASAANKGRIYVLVQTNYAAFPGGEIIVNAINPYTGSVGFPFNNYQISAISVQTDGNNWYVINAITVN